MFKFLKKRRKVIQLTSWVEKSKNWYPVVLWFDRIAQSLWRKNND